jgi:hypothetical protein
MMYTGRWIWCGGPISWPPWSPDLTLLDFFLWGQLKEHVYAVLPMSIKDLVMRLHTQCQRVVASKGKHHAVHCHFP